MNKTPQPKDIAQDLRVANKMLIALNTKYANLDLKIDNPRDACSDAINKSVPNTTLYFLQIINMIKNEELFEMKEITFDEVLAVLEDNSDNIIEIIESSRVENKSGVPYNSNNLPIHLRAYKALSDIKQSASIVPLMHNLAKYLNGERI